MFISPKYTDAFLAPNADFRYLIGRRRAQLLVPDEFFLELRKCLQIGAMLAV